MDRFLTVYLRTAAGERLIDWITRSGARLDYPGSVGEVALLDMEGEHHLVSRAAFSCALQEDALSTTFQTWFAGWEDMVVTIERGVGVRAGRAGTEAVTFFLEGMRQDEIRRVVESLTTSFSEVVHDVVGYVQVYGQVADFDWDVFMTYPVTVPPLPDLLVLSEAFASDTGWGTWWADTPSPGLMTLRSIP